MLEQVGIVCLTLTAILIALLYKKVRSQLQLPHYYEITVLLGSGGHTGQITLLFEDFDFKRVDKINVLISENDKTSQTFFTKGLKEKFQSQYPQIQSKMVFHYVKRTNQVKQSYLTAIFSGLLALLNSVILVVRKLWRTTHFVSNGPGTCVPFFYVFYIMKCLKLSRVKLIFFESWCRVRDLSLSGKLVKPIVDEFIVHWPELAKKYSKCKYLGKIF